MRKILGTALDDASTPFCDYGVTLRNLPGDVHASLVVDHDDGIRSRVLVMTGESLAACSGSGQELRDSAVSYLF